MVFKVKSTPGQKPPSPTRSERSATSTKGIYYLLLRLQYVCYNLESVQRDVGISSELLGRSDSYVFFPRREVIAADIFFMSHIT
jgi:hypothetical protein